MSSSPQNEDAEDTVRIVPGTANNAVTTPPHIADPSVAPTPTAHLEVAIGSASKSEIDDVTGEIEDATEVVDMTDIVAARSSADTLDLVERENLAEPARVLTVESPPAFGNLPYPGDTSIDASEGQQAANPVSTVKSEGLADSPARRRFQRLIQALEPFMPWASLAGSIWGAISMDRSESRGATVAIASVASFLGLLVLSLLSHPSRAEAGGKLHSLARFASFTTSQSLVQLSLFFSAPFYAAASAWTIPQCIFAVCFVCAGAVVSWDPLATRLFEHPIAGSALTAFASFCGANAALPMLGVPHLYSTLIASVGVGLFIPVLAIFRGQSTWDRLGALVIGIATPMIVFLGGARALPPAPLNLVSAKLGTQVVDREVQGTATHFSRAPNELFCWTAIHAPLGLKDALTHEWRRDGELVLRMPLSLRGGRKQGFRTWSRMKLSAHSHGTFRCEVVTSLGQPLGGTEVVIGN